jgi:hypothetical protein
LSPLIGEAVHSGYQGRASLLSISIEEHFPFRRFHYKIAVSFLFPLLGVPSSDWCFSQTAISW